MPSHQLSASLIQGAQSVLVLLALELALKPPSRITDGHSLVGAAIPSSARSELEFFEFGRLIAGASVGMALAAVSSELEQCSQNFKCVVRTTWIIAIQRTKLVFLCSR